MSELKSKRNLLDAGFSLIELVVVIAVLGIITAIALPSFLGIRKWFDENEARQVTNGVIKSAALFAIKTGDLPTTWVDIASFYPSLNYCKHDQAIRRQCGSAVGDPVSSIDPIVNPLNCITVTQASYKICGRSSADKFQVVMIEDPNILEPSDRRSVSACINSQGGATLVPQETREPVWIDC